jgi:hypothetical protein
VIWAAEAGFAQSMARHKAMKILKGVVVIASSPACFCTVIAQDIPEVNTLKYKLLLSYKSEGKLFCVNIIDMLRFFFTLFS